VQEDPFGKVKKMTRDMISKLMSEATAETEHKGWCDAELGANKITRDEKSASVDSLTAEVEKLTATIAQTTQKIADLNAAIAELDVLVKTSTETRTKDHATNTQAVKDAKEAQHAVAQALTVLREFYAKAGEATALVQVQGKKQSPIEDTKPEIFETGYQGMQDVKGGVVGMLEVIQSDFVRLQSETEQTEAEDAASYERLMQDSKVDKAVKQTDAEHLAHRKASLGRDLEAAKRDLHNTSEELSAAQKYYDKLKPSCVDSGVTYEERVARREEEIQSLKEALKILAGEEI